MIHYYSERLHVFIVLLEYFLKILLNFFLKTKKDDRSRLKIFKKIQQKTEKNAEKKNKKDSDKKINLKEKVKNLSHLYSITKLYQFQAQKNHQEIRWFSKLSPERTAK